jgi:hypothetical protein
MHPTLILTLELDPDSFACLDGLRRAHFPPERNIVPAHVTLFHALPGSEREDIAAVLSERCSEAGALELRLAGPRFLGRGVAIDLACPPLLVLRRALAAQWADRLSPQDRQRYRPHATIQNKAEPSAARCLYESLSSMWTPRVGRGVGLLLWHYRGGPWEPAARFPFGRTEAELASQGARRCD